MKANAKVEEKEQAAASGTSSRLRELEWRQYEENGLDAVMVEL